MNGRRGGLVRKSAACPECEHGVYQWREQRGIRRFQAKAKKCPECGHTWR